MLSQMRRNKVCEQRAGTPSNSVAPCCIHKQMPAADCVPLNNTMSMPSYGDPINEWFTQDSEILQLHTANENLASQHLLAIFHDLCPANGISTSMGLQVDGELL